MKASILNRKLHRWGAVLIAAPLLIVIGSGLLLQLKKDVAWIQPPTVDGARAAELELSFAEILEISRGVAEAEIDSWDDVDRLDVRPVQSVVKVRSTNRWEIQIDTASGAILQTAFRRSDLIESIHDGSFFHESAKLWIFLPVAIVLLGLWFTGIYLWFLPHLVRRRKLKRATNG